MKQFLYVLQVLLNKKLIANFGYIFSKPLTDFVAINDDKISFGKKNMDQILPLISK